MTIRRARCVDPLTPVRIPEKVEQQHTVQFLRSIGSAVYVLGTRRKRGDHQGTMQTPGVSDLIAFVPKRGDTPLTDLEQATGVTHFCLFVESKAKGGRLRPEQVAFRAQALCAGVEHVVGGFDAVIAWAIGHGLVRDEAFPHYRRPAQTVGQ